MTEPLQSSSYSTTEPYARLRDDLAAAEASLAGRSRPNRSRVISEGLLLKATEYAVAATHELALGAVALFGRDAALWATRDLILVGEFEYSGRWVQRDDDGTPRVRKGWNFHQGPLETPGSRGLAHWDLGFKAVEHQGAVTIGKRTETFSVSVCGVQITSGQGVSPTGHPPYIWLGTGTTRPESREPLPVWDWLDRVRLADPEGNVFDPPLSEDD